jgi:hypothetical protein
MVGEDRGFGVLSVRNIKGLRVNLPLEDLGSVEEGVGVAMMQIFKFVYYCLFVVVACVTTTRLARAGHQSKRGV